MTERSDYIKDLENLRRETRRRLRDCGDAQFSGIGNLMITVAEKIDAYEGGGKNRETALNEFQKRLAERTAAKNQGRGKSA